MFRITASILTRLAPSPTLMARANIVKILAEPVVKAVGRPALQNLEKAFATEILRSAGSQLFFKIGGEGVVKHIVMNELAHNMARVTAPKLSSPGLMLSFVGAIHVGELTVQQICVNYGLSLAAIAASVVADEQARRVTKIHPVVRASDTIIATNWGDMAISENRRKIYKDIWPNYKSEQDLTNVPKPIAQPVAKKPLPPKIVPYRPVPIVAKLPVVVEGKPVPNVAKLPSLDEIIPRIFGDKKRVNKADASPQKQPVPNVKKQNDEEQIHQPLIASRTVLYVEKDNQTGEDRLVGNSTYIKLDPKNPEKKENLVALLNKS
jgi:hypothetical protein